MIRTQELVPDYYIEKSRDFQILCRILDFMYNSTKYNSSSMLNMTNTRQAKDTILPLIGDKFGIYDKDAYSTRELLEALPYAIKYKGSLHSVLTLVNAFLDSMQVFDYAAVYDAKDEESASKVGALLNRKIKPYTIVIVLSSYPNLTKLRILDVYLRMVIPTGMFVEYVFGFDKKTVDKYRYEDFVILYYTKEVPITMEKTIMAQEVSLVRSKDDAYKLENDLPEDASDLVKEVSPDNANVLVNSVGISSIQPANKITEVDNEQ